MLGLALGLSAGCYQPDIKSGQLRCADGGTGLCPSGFTCVAGRCVSPGARTDGGGPRDGTASGDASDAPICETVSPRSGCTVQTSPPLVCDPVCRTGCGCGRKCSSSTEGVIGCFPADLQVANHAPLEACTVQGLATATQSDNCEPGSMCLGAAGYGSSAGTFCFSLCRTAADCPTGLACNPRRVGVGGSPVAVMVCDLPFTPCDPGRLADGADSVGCPKERPQCYLVAPDSTGGSRTVCELAAGDRGRDTDCALPRDCIQGQTCPTADGVRRCRPVCDPAMAGSCIAPTVCKAYGKKYGYCM